MSKNENILRVVSLIVFIISFCFFLMIPPESLDLNLIYKGF
jgi:hypothetical protein